MSLERGQGEESAGRRDHRQERAKLAVMRGFVSSPAGIIPSLI
jgi:hypothetical protein